MTGRGDRPASPARAAVLAPTPLLTVTIEQVADGDEIHLHAGGQAVWQARMLAVLGLDVRLCAALAGEAGTVVQALAGGLGVQVEAVSYPGTSGAYVQDRRSGERQGVATMAATPVGRHDIDDLYGRFLVSAIESDVALLGGPDDPAVVDPDLYRRLAADLGDRGTIVVVDLTGQPLDAALEGGVDVVKISDDELGCADAGSSEVLARAADLMERGADTVVVTRSDAPTIACSRREAWQVDSLQFEAVDHSGAGDSFTAACAAALASGGGLEHALRLGAAAGALNVTRHGLASGDRDHILRLAEEVVVRPLDHHLEVGT